MNPLTPITITGGELLMLRDNSGRQGQAFVSITDLTNYLVAHGVKGDQGDPGPKGDQGNPGAKGDQGNPGAKGDQGDAWTPTPQAAIADATSETIVTQFNQLLAELRVTGGLGLIADNPS